MTRRRPLDIDVAADPGAALAPLADPSAWPTVPHPCYGGRGHPGRAPLPVTLRLGADHVVFFDPDALRTSVLYSRRLCAVAGPEAVAADAPPPGAVDAYRDRFGEFAARYELERWYAPFGGARRRILAALLPGRDACLAECPPAPKVVFTSLEDAARPRKVEIPAEPIRAPRRPAMVAAGQQELL